MFEGPAIILQTQGKAKAKGITEMPTQNHDMAK